jgi:hypothetical protein
MSTCRAQGIRNGGFQMFDYGLLGNLENYGQFTPPQYDLSSISTNIPLAMYSGAKDLLADPIGTQNSPNITQTMVASRLLTKRFHSYHGKMWPTCSPNCRLDPFGSACRTTRTSTSVPPRLAQPWYHHRSDSLTYSNLCGTQCGPRTRTR